MKRVLSLALLVLATAQVPPPMGPRAPLTASSATAQTGNHGITVSASGNQTVSADDAQISLQLGSADNRLSLTKETLQPIADALVKAGADPSTVTLPINFSAPGASNYGMVTATVHKPTVAMLKSGVVTVGTSIASMNTIRLNGAQVVLRSQRCDDALARARSQAIDRARQKAMDVARQLGVKLGSVVNFVTNDGGPSAGGCMTQYYVGPNGPQFNNSLAAPSDDDYITIPVTSFVTITYAIK